MSEEAEEAAGSGIEAFHVFGLDLSRPRQSVVTLDGQRLRGVVRVEVDAPATSQPYVTVVFMAQRVTGIEERPEPEPEVVTIPRQRWHRKGWFPEQDQVIIDVYALEGAQATVEALARIGVTRTPYAVKARVRNLKAAGLMGKAKPGGYRRKKPQPTPEPDSELAPAPVPVPLDLEARRDRLQAAKTARESFRVVTPGLVHEVLTSAERPMTSREVTNAIVGHDAWHSRQETAHREVAPILSALVAAGKAALVKPERLDEPCRYRAVAA